MATPAEEHKVAVKLLVHKKQNKVIFAEADNHFADILFSFLTLPLGTIVRLVGREQSDLKLGCLTNLYQSVSELDTKFFSTEMCKEMLLYPRNYAEAECRGLKVSIDDTEPTKYFICPCIGTCLGGVGSYKNVLCSCGRPMTESIPFKDDFSSSNTQEAIFFWETTALVFGDDLNIVPSSPKAIMELLNLSGITDVKALAERVVHVGMKEILNLLKYGLISKTPLTDAFLRTGHQAPIVKCEPNAAISSNDEHNSNAAQKFTLEVLVRKSDNKILFAEANEAFINQIFSFLTIPLGLVVRLLGGNSSCGSIDELYASLMNKKLERYLVSPGNSKLLHPKLALHFNCETQLLPRPLIDDNNRLSLVTDDFKYLRLYRDSDRLFGPPYRYDKRVLNPKFRSGSHDVGGNFVKSPAAFVVTDDLVVKPASSILSASFLEHLIMPKSDVEEKVIEVGIHEVYKLLNYSLFSESTLTQALMVDLLKIPKQEK